MPPAETAVSYPLEGASVLLTGATGGMGRACTLAAVEQGYQVVLADLSDPKLEQLAADCVQQGGSAQCHTLDVTQPDTVAALAAVPQQ